MQTTLEVAPRAGDQLPTSQFTQALLILAPLMLDHVPPLHEMQPAREDTPNTVDQVPTSQFTQTLESVAPCTVANVPTPHEIQEVAAKTFE